MDLKRYAMPIFLGEFLISGGLRPPLGGQDSPAGVALDKIMEKCHV